ncbi:c-type cytochrome [Fictibacillus nanhaiensis]|uniref:Menaquinol:cytochrome c reductase cytochrome c subunit n=2 Tax=Fictibacillus TaxID=1329200 RepID=A0A160IMT8_9BACL|nr:menaquinol-cytochrome c reductase cytochrome b/c subunit [Fictibacillus phosphorivorans]ANC77668.1 cytochrome C oxidase Cbb3 [Fictibacillus phosphorivorans]MBN3555901.1 c-type cytochrome [Fictibacillus nanhaiensis]MQR95795.1 cytochrome C oxidase Cbb3 [Fictibacillus phosphorivorans]
MHRGKGMKFVGDSRVPAERKPNIPKDYSEFPGKTEAFWPNFLLKEWMVGAVFLIGYLILTIVHESPLEKKADPTDAGYIPLPDWYFLFLYQLLKYKYAAGDYVLIGTVIIPGLAFGALMLAPFLDKGLERRPSKRPIATGLMLLGLISVTYLTWESVVTHDWEKAKTQGKIVDVSFDENDPGYKIYQKQSCVGCHGNTLSGGASGPSLVGTGLKPEEIMKIAKEGKPPAMPPNAFKGSDKELKQLAEFISKLEKK